MSIIKLYLFSWLLFSHAWAETDTLQIITAPEVKYMVSQGNTLLIHALSEIEYELQHIPESINIPVTEMYHTDKLPEDKNKRLIFYCMGAKCSYSERACQAAVDMGYTQVYWFRGGIPEWRRFNYSIKNNPSLNQVNVEKLSPAKVSELIQTQAVFILDVRPLWWKVIPKVLSNSHFMPLVTLQYDYKQLPKNKPILVVDGYMKQSPSAARFLIGKGYQVAGVLKGGIRRWDKEGYPTDEHKPD